MKVIITDSGFPDVEVEKKVLKEFQVELVGASTEDELLDATRDADALLVQWAPITKRVIENLSATCKLIVRYGIGVDNIDLQAARSKRIPVCNVPDYCIDEVADHAVAMAMGLHRQLAQTHDKIKDGVWSITPPRPIRASRETFFATIGFGRIAQAVVRPVC
jgi:D-3-phosphoglycerate dehydrogenase / 2-oxoglutarate reductase